MKRIIAIVLVLITLISGNVCATSNYINVRYVKKGQTVKLQTYVNKKLKVKVEKVTKTRVKVSNKKALTQLVYVRFKVTAPKGLYPMSKYKTDEAFEKPLGKNKAYRIRTKLYKPSGKAVSVYYPARNDSLYSHMVWDHYYYKDTWDEHSIKSWIIECEFFKKPSQKYIIGITAADKEYKDRKSMPKRYRNDNIDKWFTKHKNYTVFVKIS